MEEFIEWTYFPRPVSDLITSFFGDYQGNVIERIQSIAKQSRALEAASLLTIERKNDTFTCGSLVCVTFDVLMSSIINKSCLLHCAVRAGIVDAVTDLIFLGFDVNKKVKFGASGSFSSEHDLTPIAVAIEKIRFLVFSQLGLGVTQYKNIQQPVKNVIECAQILLSNLQFNIIACQVDDFQPKMPMEQIKYVIWLLGGAPYYYTNNELNQLAHVIEKRTLENEKDKLEKSEKSRPLQKQINKSGGSCIIQ
jgi:hypothetical protein